MHHNLSGSGDRRVMLSNYALSLQVIFYLQAELILPSVKRLQQKMDDKDRTEIQIDGKAIEHGFPSDIEKWSSEEMDMPINSKTLIQLLHGFFRFYATFDYLNFAISPNSGQMKLRFVHLYLEIFVNQKIRKSGGYIQITKKPFLRFFFFSSDTTPMATVHGSGDLSYNNGI